MDEAHGSRCIGARRTRGVRAGGAVRLRALSSPLWRVKTRPALIAVRLSSWPVSVLFRMVRPFTSASSESAGSARILQRLGTPALPKDTEMRLGSGAAVFVNGCSSCRQSLRAKQGGPGRSWRRRTGSEHAATAGAQRCPTIGHWRAALTCRARGTAWSWGAFGVTSCPEGSICSPLSSPGWLLEAPSPLLPA